MCNASNHPLGCMCGFGGEGHSGTRTEGNIIKSKVIRFDRQNYKSYTNPNAKCPVCGVPVWFFRSENGGSVFFDDLGKPWPKHHCTNNSTENKFYDSKTNRHHHKQTQWEKHGWIPVILEEYPAYSATIFFVERIDKSSRNHLDIVHDSYSRELMKNNVLVFFKRSDKKYFKLAAFDLSNQKEIELKFGCNASTLDKFCK